MDNNMKKVFECGIVPVIKINDADDAVNLGKALLKGGINVAEVTFRTNAAEAAIKNMAEALPDMLVGAGTVLTVDLAKKAVAAGAKFIVTPGFNVRVVEYCLENKILVLPGTSCPTDIETGLSYGLEVMKFFPAEASGGIKALKAMCAPYGMVKFMPTGGIDATNITDYLSFDKIVACGGSWMVKDDLISSKNFNEIARLSEEAVMKMHNFQFVHMGINMPSKDEAQSTTNKMKDLFGFARRETSAGFFAGAEIEIMNTIGLGQHGHIGLKTTNVARAIAYLKNKGVEVDYTTLRGTEENPTFIYLKESFGGFALHIMQ